MNDAVNNANVSNKLANVLDKWVNGALEYETAIPGVKIGSSRLSGESRFNL